MGCQDPETGKEEIVGTDKSYVIKEADQGKDLYLTVKAKDNSDDYTGKATSQEALSVPAAATPTPAPIQPTTPTPTETPAAEQPTQETPAATPAETPQPTPEATPTPEAEAQGSNESLIAGQQIVIPPQIEEDFRLTTVDKVYAFARKDCRILEEKSDEEDAAATGSLPGGGVCYILQEDEDGWVFVESGRVRGFIRKTN